MEKSGKHFHHGRSSREILDSSRVLSTIELKEGDVLLDAGSGDGYMSLAASSIVGENGTVYAVDIYEDSMEILKNEIKSKDIKNITPVIADISEKIPVADESIDVLYMGNVLHGFVENDEVETVMGEIQRVIKSNGAFAVVEFKKEESKCGPPLSVKIAPEDVKKIMQNYGFTVKKVEEVGTHHYVVISIKKWS